MNQNSIQPADRLRRLEQLRRPRLSFFFEMWIEAIRWPTVFSSADGRVIATANTKVASIIEINVRTSSAIAITFYISIE
jgi:hypothetical protein